MSTPDGEPLLGADYESREMSRDMDLGWHVPRIAADRELMKAAAKEYALRLMFEKGLFNWIEPYGDLWKTAGQEAITEYLNSKVIKGGTCV